jgi:hypothetical protein
MYKHGTPDNNLTYELEPSLKRDSLKYGMMSYNRRIANAEQSSPRVVVQEEESGYIESGI